MKNLILLLVLFIPFSLIAQVNAEITNAKTDDQTEVWMTKISSDSEMRTKMMTMMIDKTKGNKIEMTKLANCIMDNPEMHTIMMATNSGENEIQINSIEPRGMNNNNIKVGVMNKIEPMLKK